MLVELLFNLYHFFGIMIMMNTEKMQKMDKGLRKTN
jgi:hypothetical protein